MNITKSLLATFFARLKLFGVMMVAASTSGLAIYLAGCLAACGITYWESMALFLGYRVLAFMRNPQSPLNDENVYQMSVERILWNVATLAILAVTLAIKALF